MKGRAQTSISVRAERRAAGSGQIADTRFERLGKYQSALRAKERELGPLIGEHRGADAWGLSARQITAKCRGANAEVRQDLVKKACAEFSSRYAPSLCAARICLEKA